MTLAAPAAARAQAGPPAAPPAVPVSGVEEEYRIGPEDVISVVVLGEPEYTRIVPVRPDGRISLPVINDLQAAGLTVNELRDELVKRFSKIIKPDVLEVSVIVTEVHSFKVSVIGNVRTPNRFEVRSRVSVLDALSMAGGFTDFAKRDKIQIVRVDGSTITFDYSKFIERPNASGNVMLRPGDIVIVY